MAEHDEQGLIAMGTEAGEALARFLAAIAHKPAHEVADLLRLTTDRLSGAESPIPQPLRSVVAPAIQMVGNAVALVPESIGDVAEAGGRVLTGDESPKA